MFAWPLQFMTLQSAEFETRASTVYSVFSNIVVSSLLGLGFRV